MNKKIFTLIRHNFLIKIVALLIAILLWFYLREEKKIIPESVQSVRNFKHILVLGILNPTHPEQEC